VRRQQCVDAEVVRMCRRTPIVKDDETCDDSECVAVDEAECSEDSIAMMGKRVRTKNASSQKVSERPGHRPRGGRSGDDGGRDDADLRRREASRLARPSRSKTSRSTRWSRVASSSTPSAAFTLEVEGDITEPPRSASRTQTTCRATLRSSSSRWWSSRMARRG